LTWTVKLAVLVLPFVSEAVQRTVVVPIGNTVPDAGTQANEATASSGSVAVTVYVTTAPLGDVALIVIASGTAISAVLYRWESGHTRSLFHLQ
jgi:hypothetical protein